MPSLDRGAEPGTETSLLVEAYARLRRDRPIELGPTDDAEVDEDLSEPLSAQNLGLERVVELRALNRTLLDEHRPEQGLYTAVVLHVLLPP